MNLFAYGTLQFEEVWRRVVGRDFPTVAARVDGFAVYRVDGYDFPGMTPREGATTVGTVFYRIDDEALTRLDAFEGDFYERWTLSVAGDDGQRIEADGYVVPAASAGLLTGEPWTRESFVASGGLSRFLNRYAGFSAGDEID